jgi:hypothetical protein
MLYFMRTSTVITSLALVAGSSSLWGQTILFQHDFSTSGAGGIADPAVWHYDGRPTPTNSALNIRPADQDFNRDTLKKHIEVISADSETLFGEANNPYLRFAKESANGSLWITANNKFSTPSEVVTVAFDFRMPSTTSWGTANPSAGADPRIRLGINDPVASNGNRVPHEIRFGQGGTGGISNEGGVFSLDTTHSILIVYNYSANTVGYVGGSGSVAAYSYDVWIDGRRVIAGAGGPSTNSAFYGVTDGVQSPGVLSSIGIAGFNDQAAEFFMDNLVVYSNAIPEPSTYALGAGILALGIAAYSRRRRLRTR